MANKNIEHLMYVTKISAKKLADLTQTLSSPDIAPRRVSGLIQALEREATVLSQSTQKLSGYCDAMRDSESIGVPTGPPPDDNLLKIIDKIRSYENICETCGGVRGDHDGEYSELTTAPGAYIRARERESESQNDE